MCALCLKWNHSNKEGATKDSDQEFESTYMSGTVRNIFAWMNEQGNNYKNTELKKRDYDSISVDIHDNMVQLLLHSNLHS
jgi:hypothetical protein